MYCITVPANTHYCIEFNDCFPCKACHKERAKLTVFLQETVTSCISSHVWGHEIIIGKKFAPQGSEHNITTTYSIMRRNSWAYYLMSSFLARVTGLRQAVYFNAYRLLSLLFNTTCIGKYAYNLLHSRNICSFWRENQYLFTKTVSPSTQLSLWACLDPSMTLAWSVRRNGSFSRVQSAHKFKTCKN